MMNLDKAIGLLRALVAIPSVNPHCNPDPAVCGEDRLAAFLEQWGKVHDISCRRIVTHEGRPCVLFTLGGETPEAKTLLWCAHMDTVWPGEMDRPFELHDRGDGCYAGLGAVDDKGSLCAALLALEELKSAPLPCRIQLSCSCDEEAGFTGITAMAPAEVNADGAVVLEGTSLNVASANKGTARYQIVTHGKAAHASSFWHGENAVYKIAPFIAATEQLGNSMLAGPKHPLLGTSTVSLGVIRGGIQVNSVPDRCEFIVDYRLLPGETPEDAKAKLQAAYNALNLAYELTGPLFYTAPFETPSASPLVRYVLKQVKALVPEAVLCGVRFSTEAGRTGECGIPTVIFGPGTIPGNAHSPREHIRPDEIVRAASCLVAVARNFHNCPL